MTVLDEDEHLVAEHAHIATRAAHEGIPVAAIARILQQPFGLVVGSLRIALSMGAISNIPKADWPPGSSAADHVPSVPTTMPAEDIEFACRQLFRLTPLEVGFLMTLLRHTHVDKEKLHGVIESQRSMRTLRLDNQEATDPKMVDVMICKLRKKLVNVDPTLLIKTSWGKGYYVEGPVKAAVYKLVGLANAFGPDPERAVADAPSA